MEDKRKERFIELSKNKGRTPVEETERAALAAEFPETAKELEQPDEPKVQVTGKKVA